MINLILIFLWVVVLALVGCFAALSIFRWIDGTMSVHKFVFNMAHSVIMAAIGCIILAKHLEPSGVANPSGQVIEKAK